MLAPPAGRTGDAYHNQLAASLDREFTESASEDLAARERRRRSLNKMIQDLADKVQETLDRSRSEGAQRRGAAVGAVAEAEDEEAPIDERALNDAFDTHFEDERAEMRAAGRSPEHIQRVEATARHGVRAWIKGLGLIELMCGERGLEDLFLDQKSTQALVAGDWWDWEAVPDRRFIRLVEKLNNNANPQCSGSDPQVEIGLPQINARAFLMHPSITHGIGWAVNVRYFPEHPYSLADLVNWDYLTPDAADFLVSCVLAHANIAIIGETGSGKSTLQLALLNKISPVERVVFAGRPIEQVPDLKRLLPLWMKDVSEEGRGRAYGVPDVGKAALRVRAQRVCLAEVWGDAFADIIDVYYEGHRGGIITAHGENEDDFARNRASTMYRRDRPGTDRSEAAEIFASAFDVLVHCEEGIDGSGKRRRAVKGITIVQGTNVSRDITTLRLQKVFERADVGEAMYCLGLDGSTFSPSMQERFRRWKVAIPTMHKHPAVGRIEGRGVAA